MANALDAVLQMRREKIAREQAIGQSIAGGIQGGIDNFVKLRTLQQNQQKNELNQQLIQAKIAALPTDNFIRQGQVADAANKLYDAGMIDDKQYDAMLSGLNNVAVKRNLNQYLNQGQQTALPSDNMSPSQRRKQRATDEAKAKAELQVETAKNRVRATKTEELNLKREDLKRDLASVLALESTIPRTEGGVERFVQGASNAMSGFTQNSPVGQNISTYENLVDQITPKVSRASGDVANIAVAERQFAKKAFPTLSDSKGTAQKKRAFLTEFSKALDSKDPNSIKQILDKQGVSYYDIDTESWKNLDKSNPIEFATVEEAEKANLPKGTPIIVGGRKAVWE